MKKLFTLFALTVFAASSTFALTEQLKSGGAKNTDLKGISYTLPGTYVAGGGSTQAGDMLGKGLKLRTGSDGARAVFNVNAGYVINAFSLDGISNYELKDDATEPCISVTKVEVDGVELDASAYEHVGFPAKGESTSGHVYISGIEAKTSIALYFDNTNSKGSQINATWTIEYTEATSDTPLSTVVTPAKKVVEIGNPQAFTGEFKGGTFNGAWKSLDESVATVDEAGVVTGVAEGATEIVFSWKADDSQPEYRDTANIVVKKAFNSDNYEVAAEYDFASYGAADITIESESIGNIWNKVNSVNNAVFRCTNEGLTSIAIQAVLSSNKGWSMTDEGLALGSGAGRCAAICDVKAGQIVEFTHNSGTNFFTQNDGEDDGAEKTPWIEEDGHHVYLVDADGMVGFEISAGKVVSNVKVWQTKGTVPSAINTIAAKADVVSAANEIFNLNGQRVAAPVKGLYIVNGKKVVIK